MLTRTPYEDAVKQVLDVLGKKKSMSISDVSREAKVNWKTAKKALELLSKVADILDGRVIGMRKIGTNKVFQIEPAGPTVSHATEIDFQKLYKMYEELGRAVELLEKSPLDLDQMDAKALIKKVTTELGVDIGVTRCEPTDDMLNFERACNIIETVGEDEVEAESTIDALGDYFNIPSDLFTSKWALEVIREMKREWFLSYKLHGGTKETAVEFLTMLKGWLEDKIKEKQIEEMKNDDD